MDVIHYLSLPLKQLFFRRAVVYTTHYTIDSFVHIITNNNDNDNLLFKFMSNPSVSFSVFTCRFSMVQSTVLCSCVSSSQSASNVPFLSVSCILIFNRQGHKLECTTIIAPRLRFKGGSRSRQGRQRGARAHSLAGKGPPSRVRLLNLKKLAHN